jgi:hypothetical protein
MCYRIAVIELSRALGWSIQEASPTVLPAIPAYMSRGDPELDRIDYITSRLTCRRLLMAPALGNGG